MLPTRNYCSTYSSWNLIFLKKFILKSSSLFLKYPYFNHQIFFYGKFVLYILIITFSYHWRLIIFFMIDETVKIVGATLQKISTNLIRECKSLSSSRWWKFSSITQACKIWVVEYFLIFDNSSLYGAESKNNFHFSHHIRISHKP